MTRISWRLFSAWLIAALVLQLIGGCRGGEGVAPSRKMTLGFLLHLNSERYDTSSYLKLSRACQASMSQQQMRDAYTTMETKYGKSGGVKETDMRFYPDHVELTYTIVCANGSATAHFTTIAEGGLHVASWTPNRRYLTDITRDQSNRDRARRIRNVAPHWGQHSCRRRGQIT